MTTTTTTTTTSSGQTVNQTTQTVAPVAQGSGGTDGLADIPLVSDASGNPLLAVGLPTGVGLQVTSISGTGLSLNSQVNTAVQGFTSSSGDPTLATTVTQVLQDAFGSVPPADLVVRSMTVTVQGTTAPTQPIQISGSTDGNEALIIDVSKLPSGTVLNLSNVRFAVIVGNTNIVGGEGRNIVVADGGRQFMVLGEDDDELHAGSGDDTVGSKGGNDQLWGDDGNDWVVGGTGNDTLYGGNDNDVLQGGASDAGSWSISRVSVDQIRWVFNPSSTELADRAAWVETAVLTTPSGVGHITDQRFGFVHKDNAFLQDVAMLFEAVVGRLPNMQEMGVFASGTYNLQQLGRLAHDAYVQQSGIQPQVLEVQIANVINKVWGGGAASDSLVSLGVNHLNAGGTWADVWLYLIRDAKQVSAFTNTQEHVSLVSSSLLGETGWSANSGNNELFGGAGNDVLVGGGGNDLLDGGDGIDMAVFFGALSDFQVKRVDGDIVIKHTISAAVDTLRNVEWLKVGGEVFELNAGSGTSVPTDGSYVNLAPQVTFVGVAQVDAAGFHAPWL